MSAVHFSPFDVGTADLQVNRPEEELALARTEYPKLCHMASVHAQGLKRPANESEGTE